MVALPVPFLIPEERFLKNGSVGSGSAVGSREKGSDCSESHFWWRFLAILTLLNQGNVIWGHSIWGHSSWRREKHINTISQKTSGTILPKYVCVSFFISQGLVDGGGGQTGGLSGWPFVVLWDFPVLPRFSRF